MREKIEDKLHEWYFPESHEAVAHAGLIELANQILTLISKEIERVEKPKALRGKSELYSNGFEDCRLAILDMLRGTI